MAVTTNSATANIIELIARGKLSKVELAARLRKDRELADPPDEKLILDEFGKFEAARSMRIVRATLAKRKRTVSA